MISIDTIFSGVAAGAALLGLVLTRRAIRVTREGNELTRQALELERRAEEARQESDKPRVAAWASSKSQEPFATISFSMMNRPAAPVWILRTVSVAGDGLELSSAEKLGSDRWRKEHPIGHHMRPDLTNPAVRLRWSDNKPSETTVRLQFRRPTGEEWTQDVQVKL